MRHPSSSASILFAFLCYSFISLTAQTTGGKPSVSPPIPALEHPPECSIKATYVYPNGECTITYYRDAPTMTNSYTVPPNTTIYLRVIAQHPFEVPMTKVTTTQLSPLDLFGSFIKNLVSPISVITIQTSVGKALDPTIPQGSIEYDQLALKLKLDDANKVFNHAKASAACLQTAKTVQSDLSCSPSAIVLTDQQTMSSALKGTVEDLATASLQTVPARSDLAPIQAKIDKQTNECGKMSGSQQVDCKSEMVRANTNMLNLGLAIDAATATQKTLVALYDNARSLQYKAPADIIYSYKIEANHSDILKTSVTDSLTKTSNDIASTTINAQYTRFAISTGVMFSTLKNKAFANAPIISNGQPVLDGSGKALTQVVVNTTRPSVVFPLVLASFRAHSFTHKCGGNCSFLFSGGVGANLSSKTADFAIGPSLQFGSVLITPALHYGRQTALTNGVQIGQQLGSSPPTLPTNNFWKPAFGLSIGYVIPIGTFGASPSPSK